MKQAPLCTDFWWNNKVCAWLLHASSVRIVACVLDLVNSRTLKHRLLVNSLCILHVKRSCLEKSIDTNLKKPCFLKKPPRAEGRSVLSCVCWLWGRSARMWLGCRSFPCTRLMRSTVTPCLVLSHATAPAWLYPCDSLCSSWRLSARFYGSETGYFPTASCSKKLLLLEGVGERNRFTTDEDAD